MLREGNSDFLDKLVTDELECDLNGIIKTASSNDVKEANVHPIVKFAKMTLREVRVARRSGSFVKVAGRIDLYQNTATNDFWKISDDKKHVERLFDENNGVLA
jgi:hypothetical protein